MIDYGPFQFAAPSGTGESWFVGVCKVAGLGVMDFQKVLVPFDKKALSLRVTMVRHPCDLLGHWWRTRHKDGWMPEPFSLLRTSSFNAFLQEYLVYCPGAVGLLFDEYKADSVMRYEDQPWATVELLRSAGVPEVMLKRVSDSPLRHPLPRSDAGWDRELMRRVAQAEASVMERYDYVC